MKSSIHISFNCSNHNLQNFRHIEVNGQSAHYVTDLQKFFAALGYSDAVRNTGLTVDEFLWEEYTRDGSAKSKDCLQLKLIEYLQQHSPAFCERFAGRVEDWLAVCHAPDSTGCRASCPAHRRETSS